MCVCVCVCTSADVSDYEWLQWEETEIDQMIIGLFSHRGNRAEA